MKKIFFLFFLSLVNMILNAQNLSTAVDGNENNLNVTVDNENNQLDNSGSSINEHYDFLKDNPIDLNEVSDVELEDLFFLSQIQIQNLISYRASLGKFIDIHELQSLPGWDLATLRNIRPYVYVSYSKNLSEFLQSNFKNEKSLLLMRYVNSFSKTDSINNHSFAFRYNYDSRKNISLSFNGENDPGETFGFEKNKKGFDFTSGYVFYKGKGVLKSLIVGDYVINLGQGLIHWQSAGFNKGTSVDCIKRQGLLLKPYHSFGEFNFHRGLAIQLTKKDFSVASFVSSKKLDAYTNFDSSVHASQTISSFDVSGLHNTISSIQKKHNTHEFVAGCSIQYQKKGSVFGLNFVNYNYSLPIRPSSTMPYTLFSFRGSRLSNISFNYSHTINNFHFFGEIASDLKHMAVVNGTVIAISEKAELCFLHRLISRSYHSFYSNAFTNQSKPMNESGLYSGLGIKLSRQFQLNGFIDFYKSPWLKYSISSPSGGVETGFSLQYLPTKKTKMNFFYGYKKDIAFQFGPESQINSSGWLKNWYKMDAEFSLFTGFSMKTRLAFTKLKRGSNASETAILSYVDIHFKPSMKAFSATFRFFSFETDDYDSRIYAYENDIMYTYSINSFSGVGKGFYVNSKYKINKSLRLEAKWSMMLNRENIGNSLFFWQKSQLKLQILAFF